MTRVISPKGEDLEMILDWQKSDSLLNQNKPVIQAEGKLTQEQLEAIAAAGTSHQ